MTPEVVVVGGGVAGAALAARVAAAGVETLVVERRAHFDDRVRGEYLAAWGVRHLEGLGLRDLVDAHAVGIRTMRLLDGAQPDVDLPLDECVPGSGGARGIGHPALCDLLLAGARKAGATVIRGATCQSAPGRAPTVAVEGVGEVRPRLVVGADGAASSVRRAAGVRWARRPSVTYGAGLLVEGDRGPEDAAVEGTVGDVMCYRIPQGSGRSRLYLNYGAAAGPRWLGTDPAEGFLRSFPEAWLEGWVDAAGPCRVVPLHDGWPEAVSGEGFVLVGDAAGQCNPILGQGLALALRDADAVARVLCHEPPPTWPEQLARAHARPRRRLTELMCVAADVITAAAADFGPGGAERRAALHERAAADPRLATALLAPFVGPHLLPRWALHAHNVARLLNGGPARRFSRA